MFPGLCYNAPLPWDQLRGGIPLNLNFLKELIWAPFCSLLLQKDSFLMTLKKNKKQKSLIIAFVPQMVTAVKLHWLGISVVLMNSANSPGNADYLRPSDMLKLRSLPFFFISYLVCKHRYAISLCSHFQFSLKMHLENFLYDVFCSVCI